MKIAFLRFVLLLFVCLFVWFAVHSFAHAETLLPVLSLLDAFPVVGSLTPDNYEGTCMRTGCWMYSIVLWLGMEWIILLRIFH